MRTGTLLLVFGLLGCGGASPAPGAPPQQNAFTGTLIIAGTLPAGTTTCQAVQTVTFTAAGASVHSVNAAGGTCVTFTNSDVASHQPASLGASVCPELDATGPLVTGASFTTSPLSGPKTCQWEDLLNPPTAGSPGY
jgi:hypothetical protein